MKVRFLGERPRQVVPFNGEREFIASPGDVVSVSNVVGESLLAQPKWWAAVKESKKEND